MRRAAAVVGCLVAALSACSSGKGGGSTAAFCSVVRETAQATAEANVSVSSSAGQTRAQIQAAFKDAQAKLKKSAEDQQRLMPKLIDAAPSEIRNDIKLVTDAAKTYMNALERNDFDVVALAKHPPAAVAEATAVASASARVTAYVKTHCGVDVEAPATPPTLSPAVQDAIIKAQKAIEDAAKRIPAPPTVPTVRPTPPTPPTPPAYPGY